MSFLDWLIASTITDLFCVVFITAMVWKLIKNKKELSLIRKDLDLAMRNPQAAKRLLKERQ